MLCPELFVLKAPHLRSRRFEVAFTMSSRLLTALLIIALMMAYSSAQTATTTTDSSEDVPLNRWMGRDGKPMEPYFQPINNIQIGGCCKPSNTAANDDMLNLIRTILDLLQNQEPKETDRPPFNMSVPVPLGLENMDIPDTSLTASSEWDSGHGPQRARLNIQRDGHPRGSWSARTNNADQWIQVDLSSPTSITAVQTQGRADLDQWVKSYTVGCSNDGQTFTIVQDNLRNPTSEKIFQANTDRNTIVTNTLNEALVCRYVRLMPQTWNGHISLRMELLGLGPVTDPVPVPLGLENMDIPDSSLTASSEFDSVHGPRRARLNIQRDGNLRGAWSARTNDANQWIQVDLLSPTSITAVQTQGRADLDQWVKSYTLSCSNNGQTFTTVQDNRRNPTSDKIFQANTDRNTIVTNTFQEALVCRYVRLMPQTWNGHISLRMELLGMGPVTE